MLLHDFGDYLSSQGGFVQGTTGDLTLGMMPDAPPVLLTVYESQGDQPERTMGNAAGQAALEKPAVQVVSRAADYETARARAQLAWRLLDGLPKRTINGVQYYFAASRQSPFYMGRDEQGRPLVGFNVDVMKDVSSTS